MHQHSDRIRINNEGSFAWVQGSDIARKGVGSVIGRKSRSKDRDYRRIWVYIPSKVAEDSSFPFEPGDPVGIEISSGTVVTVSKISLAEAKSLGWAKRSRVAQS